MSGSYPPFEHVLVVDDRDNHTDPSAARFLFSYSPEWDLTRVSDASRAWRSTLSRLEAPEDTPGQTVSLRFSGSGVRVRGRAECIAPQEEDLRFSATLDPEAGQQPQLVRVPVTSDDLRTLYEVSDIPVAGSYTLTMRDFSRCVEGATVYHIDYALVTLYPETPIDSDHRFLVSLNDPLITYEGEWNSSTDRTGLSIFGLQAMRTTDSSASFEFTFYGTYFELWIKIIGPFLVSINGIPSSSGPMCTHGTTNVITYQAHVRPQPLGKPNILRFTFPETADGFYALIDGIMYTPTFETMEEMHGSVLRWDPEFFRRLDSESAESSRAGDIDGDGPTQTEPGSSNTALPDVGDENQNLVGPIVGAILGFFAVCLLLLGIWMYRRRKRRRQAALTPVQANSRPPMHEPRDQAHPTPYTKSYHDFTAGSQPIPIPYPTKSATPVGFGFAPTPYPGPNNNNSMSTGSSSQLRPSSSTNRDPPLVPVRPNTNTVTHSLQPVRHEESPLPPTSSSPHTVSISSPSSTRRNPNSSRFDPTSSRQTGSSTAPPTFVSDPAASTEEDSRSTPRLMSIIRRMRTQMDEMEPPPPYVGGEGSSGRGVGGEGASVRSVGGRDGGGGS